MEHTKYINLYLRKGDGIRIQNNLLLIPFDNDMLVDYVEILEILDENMECFIVFWDAFTSKEDRTQKCLLSLMKFQEDLTPFFHKKLNTLDSLRLFCFQNCFH